MKRKTQSTRMNPVLRSVLRQRWSSNAVKAKIHALIGQDCDKLLAYGSVLFFVASACAMDMGWTGDEPDMRIVRASVNALDDLASRKQITEVDRSSILSGMLAAQRVIEASPIEMVTNAAHLYDQHSKAWEGQV
jgi:hypothetical protein